MPEAFVLAVSATAFGNLMFDADYRRTVVGCIDSLGHRFGILVVVLRTPLAYPIRRLTALAVVEANHPSGVC